MEKKGVKIRQSVPSMTHLLIFLRDNKPVFFLQEHIFDKELQLLLKLCNLFPL